MRLRLSFLALVAVAPPAAAAELDLVTRPERVTVHPDAALVTRIGRAELPAGASALTLRGLPAALDPASVRVEGRGTGALLIGAVDVRLTPGEARPAVDAELEGRLLRLRDEREAVAARLAALDAKRAAIERYAAASPEKLGVEGRPFGVDQWAAAWDAIGTALAAVGEEARAARAAARTLDGEIAALERARPVPPPAGAPRRDVTVALEAPEAGPVELAVSYRVAGASWTPSYDVRLDTGGRDRKPALDLVRRAEVAQRTGEDWTDVALEVSTVRAARGAAAPDLPPLLATFYEPPTVRERTTPAPVSGAVDNGLMPRRSAPPPPAAALEPATPQLAAVEAGAFQATYRVPGRVAVAADGSTKAFTLDERRAEPALSVLAAPELDETAYLRASFATGDDVALLPGTASLHRDGAFVGRTRVKLTGPGESVELGFGADDRVKVVRTPMRRRESEPSWIGGSRADVREFRTTVRNGHARPMRITVTDRLPYAENAAIAVEPLKETPPATERPADKRGVLAWTFDYAPGETRELRFGWRVRWPAERELVLEPRPAATGAPRS